MKTIEAPPPVTLPDSGTATLRNFVAHFLAYDERFNASGAGIRAAMKIEAALAAVPLELEDADCALLLAAVESPQPAQMPNGVRVAAYPWRPASLCAPFLEAIKKGGS